MRPQESGVLQKPWFQFLTGSRGLVGGSCSVGLKYLLVQEDQEAEYTWYVSGDLWGEILFNGQGHEIENFCHEEFCNLRWPSKTQLVDKITERLDKIVVTIIPISESIKEIKSCAYDDSLGMIPGQCSWRPHGAAFAPGHLPLSRTEGLEAFSTSPSL